MAAGSRTCHLLIVSPSRIYKSNFCRQIVTNCQPIKHLQTRFKILGWSTENSRIQQYKNCGCLICSLNENFRRCEGRLEWILMAFYAHNNFDKMDYVFVKSHRCNFSPWSRHEADEEKCWICVGLLRRPVLMCSVKAFQRAFRMHKRARLYGCIATRIQVNRCSTGLYYIYIPSVWPLARHTSANASALNAIRRSAN